MAGMSCDQFNFVSLLCVCLVISPFYRKFLNPSNTTSRTRHIATCIIGLSMTYFAFGRQILHLFVQSIPCYFIMKYWPQKSQHVAVLLFSMVYLLWVDLRSAFHDYETYVMDITFPLTIATQKLSSVAFSLYDGRESEKKSSERKPKSISEIPSLLEFLSYLLNYQSVLVGPHFFYTDYRDFVDGSNFNVKKPNGLVKGEPSVKVELLQKVIKAVFFAMVVQIIQPYFDIHLNAREDFIASHNYPYRVFFVIVSTSLNRSRYFFAWKLGEAIQNASGFGFSGYDEDGTPKWDLLQNVVIRKVECGTNMKAILDNWNIMTTQWLRHVCYTRVPRGQVLCTFLLSSVWHGIRPGYLMTFISGAMSIEASRKLRRAVRPKFQDTALSRSLYDVLTWAVSHFCLASFVVPFVVLNFGPSFYYQTYSQFWVPQIFMAVVLASGIGKKSSPSTSTNNKLS